MNSYPMNQPNQPPTNGRPANAGPPQANPPWAPIGIFAFLGVAGWAIFASGSPEIFINLPALAMVFIGAIALTTAVFGPALAFASIVAIFVPPKEKTFAAKAPQAQRFFAFASIITGFVGLLVGFSTAFAGATQPAAAAFAPAVLPFFYGFAFAAIAWTGAHSLEERTGVNNQQNSGFFRASTAVASAASLALVFGAWAMLAA